VFFYLRFTFHALRPKPLPLPSERLLRQSQRLPLALLQSGRQYVSVFSTRGGRAGDSRSLSGLSARSRRHASSSGPESVFSILLFLQSVFFPPFRVPFFLPRLTHSPQLALTEELVQVPVSELRFGLGNLLIHHCIKTRSFRHSKNTQGRGERWR
jgi:hypothetical protein